MSDINCPYCEHEQKVDHNDGYGYEEDITHNQQCCKCDKYFAFTTSISYDYYPEKADCLNGGDHQWEEVSHCPKYRDWKTCVDCGEEKRIVINA